MPNCTECDAQATAYFVAKQNLKNARDDFDLGKIIWSVVGVAIGAAAFAALKALFAELGAVVAVGVGFWELVGLLAGLGLGWWAAVALITVLGVTGLVLVYREYAKRRDAVDAAQSELTEAIRRVRAACVDPCRDHLPRDLK